ncbi:MAG: hypothetical protein ACD_16C00232G0023 [uncultured bacterium]|nr:MAG: hypothetical protein ACD_16C00232G0023 [uncultured bacterium]OFW68629.1 MAG: hypothetical protein A2X70_01435 [Alphaproteobacteria bacterium GWC2_42_16]OFW73068.1 MAG: hypothetical protein A2Z80_00065 [Alphaproteobacteria bacterium GWA2_41_27]OFW81642.1 MAG: hypothetical protein A3E50_00065 [Alphaproteobacteria bacterium RIFCSPHIGHO2_12_FULL_42_100]OFW85284.1 MAG: hypothetical protein A2W06_00190 [Alphaproteobacteria bacterium RBG_16_42_14]OFW90542.1 MAG: hypothetical protein A3C41_026
MKKPLYFLFCFYFSTMSLNAMEDDRERHSVVPKKQIELPTNTVLENRPGGILVLRHFFADIHKYPSQVITQTIEEYTQVKNNLKIKTIIDPKELSGQVTKIYTSIRDSGKGNEQSEQVVTFIGNIIYMFPVNEKNSYRIAQSKDKKKFRICIETGLDRREGGEVYLILVPGSGSLKTSIEMTTHKYLEIEEGERSGKKIKVKEQVESKEEKDALGPPSYRFFPAFVYNAANYFYSTRLFNMFYPFVSRCSLFKYFRDFPYFSHNNKK